MTISGDHPIELAVELTSCNRIAQNVLYSCTHELLKLYSSEYTRNTLTVKHESVSDRYSANLCGLSGPQPLTVEMYYCVKKCTVITRLEFEHVYVVY